MSTEKRPATGPADPLGAEVLRHGLRLAAEEASIVVVRAAHSAMIVEGADACAAILDRHCRLVALSTATNLMHASSLRESLPAVVEDHPLDEMVEGDVFVMNDCFRGGIHANDLLVFRPVFAGDRVVYFTGTLIHVADLGGTAVGGLAPNATDVFAEGLQLPPVRLHAAGEKVEAIHRILALNSRTPDRVVGDVEALVAGTTVAAQRMRGLLDRYGEEGLARGVEDYLQGTERRMRAELASLPVGEFEGAFTIDDDGIDLDRSLVVRVTVRVGSTGATGVEPSAGIELDFSETDDQTTGAINASYSQALTGAVYAVRCFVDPSIPMNEGCYLPLDIRFRRGSLLDPNPPAACGGRVVSVTAATEAVLDALSRARPEHATAGSSVIHPYTLAGRGREPWILLSYEYGGIGARAGSDGPSATGPFFLGGRNVVPQVEPLEARFPLRFESQRLVPDSGGPGQYRGGLGIETRIRLLDDAALAVRSDRTKLPPPGRGGGEPGMPGTQYVVDTEGQSRDLPAKTANQPVRTGEVVVLRTSGGGGLGPPEERSEDARNADVADGLVSSERGADVSGEGR